MNWLARQWRIYRLRKAVMNADRKEWAALSLVREDIWSMDRDMEREAIIDAINNAKDARTRLAAFVGKSTVTA